MHESLAASHVVVAAERKVGRKEGLQREREKKKYIGDPLTTLTAREVGKGFRGGAGELFLCDMR